MLERISDALYRLTTGRDAIELGDGLGLLKGRLKYLRNRGSWFELKLAGIPTGLPSIDLQARTIRIPYGAQSVEFSAHDPDDDAPDGRAEMNVILNSKPTPDVNGEYWQALDFNTSGLTMERVLGLDEEYSQEKCYEDWYADLYDNHAGNSLYGHDNGTGIFVRTPTEIKTPDGLIVLRTRPEHEVHSIRGQAIETNKDTHFMGKNKNNGGDINWVSISRDHLDIPRRELVDARGNRARIEDIKLENGQLKFKLPKAFIEKGSTKYPIQHSTGVDPAYTQKMASWQSTAWGGSDGVWGDYDTSTVAGADNVVLSIVLSNGETGVENTLGVRANGSALGRTVTLHEAEGGGQTHCRMFVQSDANGIIECYHSDVSDADYFYLSGYWTNVTFTETSTMEVADSAGGWVDETLNAGASLVHHIVLLNGQGDTANTMGCRANGSSLERKIVVHEPEAGGYSCLDMFVKADASSLIEVYTTYITSGFTQHIDFGYFDSAMDFVEKWQDIGESVSLYWQSLDISAFLDQDGRMVDMLLTHGDAAVPGFTMGVRDGDDTTTNRYLVEHEAEGVGGDNTEFTGFSMNVKSNATGIIKYYVSEHAYSGFYLTGYFKPSATGAQSWIKFSNETVNLQEALQRARTSYKHIAETEQTTETIRHRKSFTKIVAETIELAEAVVKNIFTGAALAYIVNETIQIVHSIQKALKFRKESNETVQITETAPKARNLLQTISETLQFSEGLQKARRFIQVISDSLQLTESRTYALVAAVIGEIIKVINETIQAIESDLKSLGFIKSSSETLQIAHSIQKALGLTKTSDETVQFSESLQKARGLRNFSNEFVEVTESAQPRRGLIRNIADTIQSSETYQKAQRLLHTIGETIQTPESYQMVRNFVHQINETIQIAETALRGVISGAIIKIVNETLQIAHAIQKAMGFRRVQNETVYIDEPEVAFQPSGFQGFQIAKGVVWVRGRLQTINETLQISESLSRIRHILQIVAETIQTSEIVLWGRRRLQVIAETIQIDEAYHKVRNLLYHIAESIQIEEFVQRIRGRLFYIAENVQIDETISRLRGRLQIIAENLDLAEGVRRIRGLFYRVNETIQSSETYQKARRLLHRIAETVQVSEFPWYAVGITRWIRLTLWPRIKAFILGQKIVQLNLPARPIIFNLERRPTSLHTNPRSINLTPGRRD